MDLLSFHLFFLTVFAKNLWYSLKNLMNCFRPLNEEHLSVNYYHWYYIAFSWINCSLFYCLLPIILLLRFTTTLYILSFRAAVWMTLLIFH